MDKVSYYTRFFLIFAVSLGVNGVPVFNINETVHEDSVDGNMLIEYERQLDKPMLTLAGMAIRNLQKLHSCFDWTPWSECRAIQVGYVSVRRRTRRCGVNPITRELNKNSVNVTDIGICEGPLNCPDNYTITANKFCIKLHENKKTFADANKQCQEDDGYLLNIESELMYGNVKAYLKGFTVTNYVYIDGQRESTGSQWVSSQGVAKQFFKWQSGEPGGGLCIVMYRTNNKWYDSTCSTARPFLCGII